MVFCEKSFRSLKKIVFEKKFLPAYLCRYDLQNGVRNSFFYGEENIEIRLSNLITCVFKGHVKIVTI